MLDIETLGDKSNSVVTSIGAVVFDPLVGPSMENGSRFYETIDLQSSLDLGLKVTGSTIKWWLCNNPETLRKMFELARPVKEVLEDFTAWLNSHGGRNLHLWGKSPRFDEGKLQDVYDAAGMSVPWDFRKELDVRTLMHRHPGIWETTPKSVDAHDPIVDALTQINAVVRAHTLNPNIPQL